MFFIGNLQFADYYIQCDESHIKEVSMDYEEKLIKALGKIYLEAKSKMSKEYKVNDANMEKFVKMSELSKALADKNNGVIEYVYLEESSQPAEIQIRFTNDLVFGDGKNNFDELIAILDLSDGMNISGTGLEDGSFLISFFVEKVYEE